MKLNLMPIAMLVALLSTACMAPMDMAKRISYLGDPAPTSYSDRTVTLSHDSTYVNVTGGEIIQFNAGNQSFAWHFDGAGEYHFDLNLIAPAGFLDHKVMVYVSPDPTVNGSK